MPTASDATTDGAGPRPTDRPVPTVTALTTARSRFGAYLALTKPRIIELLLVTTVPTMLLAEQGFPSIGLVLATRLFGKLEGNFAEQL